MEMLLRARAEDACEKLPRTLGVLLLYATSVILPHLIVLAVLAVWLRWRGLSLRFFAPAMPSSIEIARAILIGIALASFSGGVLLVAFYPLSTFFPDQTGSWFFPAYVDGGVIIGPQALLLASVVWTSTVLVTPILEEVVFRGCAFTRWAESWGFRRGILLSSLVFACFHYREVGVGAMVFGIAACLLYRESKSLVTPILAHSTHNLISAGLWFAVAMSDATTLEELVLLYRKLWPLGLAGLMAGGGWFAWFLIRHWPRECEQ